MKFNLNQKIAVHSKLVYITYINLLMMTLLFNKIFIATIGQSEVSAGFSFTEVAIIITSARCVCRALCFRHSLQIRGS